jgi:hypothetical protein
MDRGVKVLVTADAVGGIWQYSIDLARGLTGLGIETILAVMGPSPSEEQLASARSVAGLEVVDTGLTLDWLAQDAHLLREAAARVAQLASEVGADIV